MVRFKKIIEPKQGSLITPINKYQNPDSPLWQLCFPSNLIKQLTYLRQQYANDDRKTMSRGTGILAPKWLYAIKDYRHLWPLHLKRL